MHWNKFKKKLIMQCGKKMRVNSVCGAFVKVSLFQYVDNRGGYTEGYCAMHLLLCIDKLNIYISFISFILVLVHVCLLPPKLLAVIV